MDCSRCMPVGAAALALAPRAGVAARVRQADRGRGAVAHGRDAACALLQAMGVDVYVPRMRTAAVAVACAEMPRRPAGERRSRLPCADRRCEPAEPESRARRTPVMLDAPAAGLDWDALRAAVAACERCTLHSTRTQTVFGVGNPKARWMFIGEAPGVEEDRQGEPFVGRAGQLLNSMIKRARFPSRGRVHRQCAEVPAAGTIAIRSPRKPRVAARSSNARSNS